MSLIQRQFTRYCALLCLLLPFGVHAQPIDPADLLAGKYGYPINGAQAGDQIGEWVDSAGDVNGDGFDDVIVKGLAFTRDQENVYVVFGKPTTTPFELSTLESGSGGFKIDPSGITPEYDGVRVGFVRGAGDVNGDGLDDLIVGVGTAGSDFGGSAFIVFGKQDTAPVQLSDIAASIGGWPINGSGPDSHAGNDVAGLGDINGDGLDDVAVKEVVAYGSNGEQTFTLSVVFGKQNTAPVALSSIAAGVGGFVITGEIPVPGVLGSVISGVGDVNGDGLGDMVVLGLQGLNHRQQYVVFGKATTTAIALDDIAQGIGGFAIVGPSSIFENCVYIGSGRGDVNADGLNDIVLACSVAINFSTIKRYDLYVVFGKSNTTPAMLETIKAGQGGFLVRLAPDAEGSRMASIVGDLNSDNRDDIFVGVGVSESYIPPRAGYVIYGGPAALPLDVANLESSQRGATVLSLTIYDDYDRSVAAAGDVNGDGRGDFIVGSQKASPGNRDEAGRAYVVFGGYPSFPDADHDGLSDLAETNTGVLSRRWDTGTDPNLADSDGDGVDDGIELYAITDPNNCLVSPAPQSAQHHVELSRIAMGQGGFSVVGRTGVEPNSAGASVASVGDVNGDGIDDVVVGDPHDDGTTLINSGHAYVIFGGRGTSTPVNLADIAQGKGGGFMIRGNRANYTGVGRVQSAGDANGDGLGDLVVSLTSDYTHASLAVVFGKSDPLPISIASIVSGAGGGYFLQLPQNIPNINTFVPGVTPGGDVNGDGLDDIVVCAFELLSTSDPQSAKLDAAVVFGKSNVAPLSWSAVTSGVAGFMIFDETTRTRATEIDPFIAGDVNGDGLADICMGGSDITDPENPLTSVQIVFGKPNSNPVHCSTLEADSAGYRIHFPVGNPELVYGSQFGYGNTSAAGDINGDGLDDIVIGAAGSDDRDDAQFAGVSVVVYGKSDSGPIDLADAYAGIGGFSIQGFYASQRSGFPVAAAGDVNADGFDDLLIGSLSSHPTISLGGVPPSAPEVYVVYGKPDSATVELYSVLAGTGGFTVKSPEPVHSYGMALSSAGDVNNDGFGDIIVGVFDTVEGDGPGHAYVVYGFAPTAPDSDQDLIPDYAETGSGMYINGDNTGTNRNNADSDGDGILDGIEGTLGTDPNDPDDFPALPVSQAIVTIIALGIFVTGVRTVRCRSTR